MRQFIPKTFDDCLGKSEYFTVQKYVVNGELKLCTTEKSFHCITCVKGNGLIEDAEIKQGDSYFMPANYGEYFLKGELEIVHTSV